MSGKKKKKESLRLEVKQLTYAYTFLLCAACIFVVSLKDFTFSIFQVSISYTIFILPILFFLIDLIIKEIGYKPAGIALLVSTIALYLSSVVVDMLFGVSFSFLNYFGVSFAYLFSQFLNLSIYYYMIDNYKTPLFFVILNLIFSLLVHNMIAMLFSSGMVFTSTFWSNYTLVIILQFIICVVLAVFLDFVKQGIDIEG